MAACATAADMAGRALLGGFFVLASVQHVLHWQTMLNELSRHHIPAPRVALTFANLFEVIAGTLLIANQWPALVASALAAYTLLVSLLMLDFWRMPPGPPRNESQQAFFYNLALIGGLLLVIANGLRGG